MNSFFFSSSHYTMQIKNVMEINFSYVSLFAFVLYVVVSLGCLASLADPKKVS